MKFKELFDSEMNPNWDIISRIDEFSALKNARHDQVWHHEDPFQHTKNVVLSMKKYLDNNKVDKNSTYYLIMISSALCHDLGKAKTYKWDEDMKRYTCKRHDIVGEQITRRLFYDENFFIRESVCYLVRWHMKLHYILDKNEEEQYKLLKFFKHGAMSIDDLFILNKCDSLGSVNDIETDEILQDRWNEIQNVIDKVQKRYVFNAYVMIGLPGSGKDTYIKNNLPNIKVLCRDDIRTEIGIKGEKPMGNKEQESEVTRIFFERLTECCKNREDFVINNTNVLRKYRDEYNKIIKQYDGTITYVYVEAPSLEANKDRRKGQMPLDVIDRMLSYMEFPQRDEYDKIIYDIQSNACM